MKQHLVRFSALLLLLVFGTAGCGGCAKRWDLLSGEEQATLRRILTHWEKWVPAKRKNGTAPLVDFPELYAGLGIEEQVFLDRVRSINPKKSFSFKGSHFGKPPEGIHFKRVARQIVIRKGKREKLDPQYLPEKVYGAYEQMMKKMKQDLGKRLLIDSGYRSPAYQLYTFLYYLPKHHYSLVETGHWIALPGYSEHGAPQQQAIDFINEQGINGEDNVEEFAVLPEYEWLLRHAQEFGFELSYPRWKKGITFEPWHWRYIGQKA